MCSVTIRIILLTLFLLRPYPGFAQDFGVPPKKGKVDTIPGELLVGYKPGFELAVSSLHKTIGSKVVNRIAYGEARVDVVRVPDKELRAYSETYLAKKELVNFVEQNFLIYLHRSPKDPRFTELWALQNTGQTVRGRAGRAGADISATKAWDITVGDPSIVVAVIDTGVDYRHPDLAPNMWQSKDTPGNGVDDDANGYIDDTFGYDFGDSSPDPKDNHGHGTHVAGTIAAVGDNGEGVTGVIWKGRIMAIKIADRRGAISVSNAVAAIGYAIQNGASVINASWGGPANSRALLEAIEEAHKANIVFVAAAGNDSLDNDRVPEFPCNYPVANIICVAATDSNDDLASFSNYGLRTVHIAAPGVNVLSLFPGSSYRFSDGTSMAAPHVAGVAALVRSREKGIRNTEVVRRILASVDKLPSLKGKIRSEGRINAERALK
jgi:subtilisin family serine protease